MIVKNLQKNQQKLGGRGAQPLKLRLLAHARFGHFASLEHTSRNPHALDLTAGENHAHALKIGDKFALGDFDNVRADAATLLGLTFADDFAAGDGTLAGDKADF